MLRLFLSIHPATFLNLTLYAVLLKVHLFLTPSTDYSDHSAPFTKLIYSLIATAGTNAEWIIDGAATLLTIIHAIILVRIVNENKMTERRTVLPGRRTRSPSHLHVRRQVRRVADVRAER